MPGIPFTPNSKAEDHQNTQTIGPRMISCFHKMDTNGFVKLDTGCFGEHPLIVYQQKYPETKPASLTLLEDDPFLLGAIWAYFQEPFCC